MSRVSNGLRPAADFLFFWRAATMVGRKISHLTTLFSLASGSPFLSRRLSMICWSKSPGSDMASSSVKAMMSMGEKTHIRYYIRKPASYQLNNQYIDGKSLTIFYNFIDHCCNNFARCPYLSFGGFFSTT